MNDTNTLKMDQAAPPNRLDAATQALLGSALDRVEGPLKVSGSARYAHEFRADRMAYGFIVTATIAKGKVEEIDATDAEAAPGVIAVIDAGGRTPHDGSNFGEAPASTGNRTISHFGQALLLVVAETFEQARAAAALVRVHYTPDPDGAYDLHAVRERAGIPNPRMGIPDHRKGRFQSAFDDAPVQVDAEYGTPHQFHCAMEPHAALADYRDGKLRIHASYQMIAQVKTQLAKQLGMSGSDIHLLSPYVGGGFGSKLGMNPELFFAAWAARELKRPVKVAQTRQQLFALAGRRSDSIQRVRLGADREGRLLAMGHDAIISNRTGEPFYEPVCVSSVYLYAAENRRISHRIAHTDLVVAVSVRAPGEAIGQLALESAMDELAHELGIDPVQLRLLNEPTDDPQTGKPFSSRNLVACLEDGARRFGWSARNPAPGAVRDGEWLVGMGMATLSRNNYLQESHARVRLEPDGQAVVETDMTDIGTGTYTILTQIAGEALGLPADRVRVALADSDFPKSSGSGGSWGAASAGSSVYLACEQLIAELARRAGSEDEVPVARDGAIIVGNRAHPFAELLGGEPLEAEGVIKPGTTSNSHTQSAFGAVFCEVGVHAATGEVRVRRMVGSFAAGRILNPKTAASQCIGGMVWGIGGALHEHGVVDTRHGHIANPDLAEYHVPVHADIPSIEAHFFEELDSFANPLRAKGLGELGICGSGAAVANAVFNATGVRVRDFPITLDKLLDGLPDV